VAVDVIVAVAVGVCVVVAVAVRVKVLVAVAVDVTVLVGVAVAVAVLVGKCRKPPNAFTAGRLSRQRKITNAMPTIAPITSWLRLR
jgi:Na+-transporting NADH:ubiquinone oxidoreductase subunit NqrE